MCSILIKPRVENQLKKLERSSDRNMIEKRLYQFAKESNVDAPGRLDTPKCHVRRMPPELRGIKKIQIGRHRIYYTGDHRKCSYIAVHIKQFKKTGVDDDDDRKFQEILIHSLDAPTVIKLFPDLENKGDE